MGMDTAAGCWSKNVVVGTTQWCGWLVRPSNPLAGCHTASERLFVWLVASVSLLYVQQRPRVLQRLYVQQLAQQLQPVYLELAFQP